MKMSSLQSSSQIYLRFNFKIFKVARAERMNFLVRSNVVGVKLISISRRQEKSRMSCESFQQSFSVLESLDNR
jgi:hypothetical protein